jgi:DNA-binding transcriptional MerR regulator
MEIGASEAARLAGVSAQTIANWRRQGWLKSRQSIYGFHAYDAEAVMEARKERDRAVAEINRLRKPPHERNT